jgi:hypothetical protein
VDEFSWGIFRQVIEEFNLEAVCRKGEETIRVGFSCAKRMKMIFGCSVRDGRLGWLVYGIHCRGGRRWLASLRSGGLLRGGRIGQNGMMETAWPATGKGRVAKSEL